MQESELKNNNNASCYHTVCKSVAMGKSLTTHIDGIEISADLLTKVSFYKQHSS